MIRAAAKNHAFAAVVVRPETYDAVLEELRGRRRARCRCRTRESLAAEAFSYTARYDTAIARWFAEQQRGLPAAATSAPSRRSSTCPTARTRTSARAYYAAGRRARARALAGPPAPRQAALVQQPARPRRGARRSSRDFERAGVRDRQAQQPVRRGARRRPLEAYRARVRVRPAERVRRRDRAQPAGRPPRRREALAEQFVEVLFAPGYEDDALEMLDAQAQRPHPRGPASAAAPLLGEQDIRQVTGGLLVQDRDVVARRARRDGGRHGARADRGRVGRPAVRLAGLPARALQRDRARPRRRDDRASAPAR